MAPMCTQQLHGPHGLPPNLFNSLGQTHLTEVRMAQGSSTPTGLQAHLHWIPAVRWLRQMGASGFGQILVRSGSGSPKTTEVWWKRQMTPLHGGHIHGVHGLQPLPAPDTDTGQARLL